MNYSGFSRHVTTLFSRLDSSPSLREAFIQNPSGIMTQLVFPGYRQPSIAQVNQANRLLFSLLSNPRFMDWANRFQENLDEQVREIRRDVEDEAEAIKLLTARLDRTVLYRELMQAVQERGDLELLYSLMVRSPNRVNYIEPGSGGTGSPCPDPEDPLCDDPDAPSDPIGPISDTFVASETVVVIIAVAAFFIVVTQIDATPKPTPEGLSRRDLQAVSGFFADRMRERAEQVRESGALTSLEAFDRGPRL